MGGRRLGILPDVKHAHGGAGVLERPQYAGSRGEIASARRRLGTEEIPHRRNGVGNRTEGLGLVDLAIDVHTAQWGTLSRLVAATEAGLVDGGVAIDEFTVLIVGEGDLRVEGSGSVWKVTPDDNGVLVGTLGA